MHILGLDKVISTRPTKMTHPPRSTNNPNHCEIDKNKLTVYSATVATVGAALLLSGMEAPVLSATDTSRLLHGKSHQIVQSLYNYFFAVFNQLL